MLRRTQRFLMLWCFIALQAMAPFIHAHAGGAPLDHAHVLHLHQVAPDVDGTGYVVEADDHGAEVAVANGLLRDTTADPGIMPARRATAPLPVAVLARSGNALSASPAPRLTLPSYTRPHALAPPAA